MAECSTSESAEPDVKRRRLSLSRKKSAGPKKKVEVAERFQKVSSPEIEKAKHGYIPVNTKQATKWAVHTFETWRIQRNTALSPSKVCPDDILLTDDHEMLSHWLCFLQGGTKRRWPALYSKKHNAASIRDPTPHSGQKEFRDKHYGWKNTRLCIFTQTA